MTMDHDPTEFLLAVGMTAHLVDGSTRENVVWKHCADHVLRVYETDGNQVTGIDTLSGGSVVVSLETLSHCKTHCEDCR